MILDLLSMICIYFNLLPVEKNITFFVHSVQCTIAKLSGCWENLSKLDRPKLNALG